MSRERLETLGRRLVDAKRRAGVTKAAATDAEKHMRAVEASMWEALDDEKAPTITLELGEGYGDVQFQRRQTHRGRILNIEEATAALEASGRADEVLAEHPAVRQKVLNEYVRELLESGESFPAGVDFSTTRFVTVTTKG